MKTFTKEIHRTKKDGAQEIVTERVFIFKYNEGKNFDKLQIQITLVLKRITDKYKIEGGFTLSTGIDSDDFVKNKKTLMIETNKSNQIEICSPNYKDLQTVLKDQVKDFF